MSTLASCEASAPTAGAYFLPEAATGGAGRRGVALAAVLAIHVLAMIVVASAAMRPEPPPPARPLAVRLLERPAPVPPKVDPPKPLPPKAPPKRVVAPPPVLAAAPSVASAPAAFAVAPQPEPVVAPPVPAAAPVVAPAAMVAARFDADYLQNPRPAYPPMSRRLQEEGKVVLRVRVSEQGLPLAVDIRQSSGFSRLDEAARKAVERWRFVPARQGEQAVESSVLVPLNFTLSN